MDEWDGVEHQFYTMTWLVSRGGKYFWGLSFSSVRASRKGWVGTWEVGTPRRVVVAKQKKYVWYSKKKGLCGGAKSWLCFACNLSNLRANSGWWVQKCTKM
jgi:hypothetical protein